MNANMFYRVSPKLSATYPLLFSLFVVIALMVGLGTANAAIIVIPNTNETQVAEAIQQGGGGVTNVTATISAHGTNTALSLGLYLLTLSPDTYGLTGDGLVISTGDVADYGSGADASVTNTTAYAVAATPTQNSLLSPITGSSTNFDATQVDITFDVQLGVSNLTFQVVFGSEEFPENNSNDGLVLILNGTNVASIASLPINVFHPGLTNAIGTELDAVITTDGTNQVHNIIVPVTPGSTNNTLTIVIGDADDDLVDSTAYLTIVPTVVASAVDLAISKIATPEPVSVGSNLTYTISVTNIGVDVASGVTVTDALPVSVTFSNATPSQGTCTNIAGVVTCALGTVSNSASASITLVVIPTVVGSITNTVTITSVESDVEPTNNIATAISTISAASTNQVDLAVTKSDSPDPVGVGSNLTYTIAITNIGPAGATGVTVVDQLVPSMTFSNAIPTQGTCTNIAGTVTCNLGSVTNGGVASIQLIVIPQSAGTFTNSASVSANETDSNAGNDSVSEITTVSGALVNTDLGVAKSDSPDPVGVDSNLTYTIVVTNLGPQTATGVTLTDTLPTSVTLTSSNATQGTITVASNVVTVTIGSLAVDEGATITLDVVPSVVGVITNVALVTADQSDNSVGNNTDTETTTVTGPNADLSVTKTADPTTHMEDCLLTYTVTVANDGPDTATNVILTDDYPPVRFFIQADPSQGTCSNDNGVVTCNLGDLADGASAEVIIYVVTGPEATLTNVATVTSDLADPNQANNIATLITGQETGVTAVFEKVESKCKEKHGVLQCKLKGRLVVDNASEEEVPGQQIRFYLSTDETFDGGDTLLGTDDTKDIKPGKSDKLKLKGELEVDPSGSFVLAVDENDNVIASEEIP